jgi:uncharacterized alpha/beta hydrolase family protein
MKQIVLLHGLHLHVTSLLFLKEKLKKIENSKISLFGYASTCYSESTLLKLKSKIDKMSDNDEIILIGHSMGGLVARLFLEKYEPQKNIKLITLGTPHKSSSLAKKIDKTFLKIFLGRSGKAGIIEKIPEWSAKYPLITFAGVSKVGIINLFDKSKQESDGTVLLNEALEEKSIQIIFKNMQHTQFLFSSKVTEKLKDVILNWEKQENHIVN